ncbi:MerR family transcriptional regulator [Actinoplanes sp. GCM10030250]|uniref:MerR family transcriptional regulator n=1 Tax=Actinoplanes sp. GCM10030250 TaxID=3273376 RepID=UPI003621485D
MINSADQPEFTMGRAAEQIGVTPAFLRSLDEAGLVEPERSLGGHRRYSRHQLDLAARVRQLLDEGFLLAAACRIVTLEDRLAAAHRRIVDLGGKLGPGEDATIPTQTRRELGTTRYYSTPRSETTPSAP